MADRMVNDIEQKETLDRTRFFQLLQKCQDAAQRNQDFEITVNGKTYTVPANAFEKGHYRLEYEIDNGEYELEFTLKWR